MHMLGLRRIPHQFCRLRDTIRQKLTIRNFLLEGDQNTKPCCTMPGHLTDFRTNEIHVHTSSNGESLSMIYFFKGKQQLLTRPRFESITRTLSRLLKFVKKSKSPKKTEPLVRTRRSAGVQGVREEVVSCEVDLHYPDESNVDLNTFQNDHIVSGLYFTMDATTFTFIRDPPLTRSMQLFPRAVVLKGYPLVLTISSELSDGVDCDWYSCLDNEEMIHVGTGETFYPTDVCVGRRLKAVCTPWRWDTDTKNSIKKKKSSDGLDHNTGDARIVEDIDSINSTTVQNESDTSMTLKNTANNNDTIERQQDKDRKRILGRPAVCYSATKVFLPISQSAILEVRKDFIELKRVQNTVTLIGDSKGVTGGGDVMSKDNDDSDNRNNSSWEDVRGDKELRVMTFNTLAEPFATSRYAKENIYLYCDNDHLDTEYRAQLVGLELLSYDADVMCLQECDAKTYKSYYYPLLSERGYDLHYTNKAGGVLEGCVTATKRDKLQVLRRIDLPLKKVLRNAPHLNAIYKARRDLRDVLGGKLGTIGQITVCQCKRDPTRILIFANTHLFFHPAAAFARLLQTDVIISTCVHVRHCIQTQGLGCLNDMKIDGEEFIEVGDEEMGSNDNENKGENENRNEKEDKKDRKDKEMCDSIIKELEKLEVGSGVRKSPLPPPLMTGSAPLSVSIMLLGDLNSTPETAVIEYFRTKQISSEHEVWESIDTFRWGPRNNDGGESSRRKSGSTSSGSEVELEVEESAEFDYDSFDELCPSAVQDGSSSSSAKSSSKKVQKAPTRSSSSNDNNGSTSNSNKDSSSSGNGSGSGSGSNVSLLPTLTHDLNIVSAAGFPTHTNYTRDFKDLLDYIYIEPSHFKILRVAPFPSEEVLSKHTALPSCAFPSDHLAVIVDLEFID